MDNRNTARISLIGLNKWRTYYTNLLTEDRLECIDVNPQIHLQDQAENIHDISTGEVKEVLSKVKNGKAPGLGNVNIKLLKAGPQVLMDALVTLFNKCLHGGKVPEEWKLAVITSVYKK